MICSEDLTDSAGSYLSFQLALTYMLVFPSIVTITL